MRNALLFSFLATSACAAFLCLMYPEMYRIMQGDSVFFFTADFFQLKLTQPPAVTSWLVSLLVQFYRWPWAGAVVQTLVVCLSSLMLFGLALRFSGSAKAHRRRLFLLLPFLPVVLFVLYPFATSLHVQILWLFALPLLYVWLRPWWLRALFALVMVPVGYLLLSFPLLALLLLLFLGLELTLAKSRWTALLPAFVLLPFCPQVYSEHVAFLPSEARYWPVKNANPRPVWSEDYRRSNTYYAVVRAAEEERWDDLRGIVREHGQSHQKIMQTYLLLAESAQGTLPERLFSYSICDPEQFLFRHDGNFYAHTFNRLFYRNLGIWDECFHQAEEYFLLLPDACGFNSLTQMVDYAIRGGEYAIAGKYLTMLDHAPFYGSYVKEQRQRIIQQQAMPDTRRMPLRADNFVGGYPFNSEMYRLIDHTDGNAKLAFDYLLCGLLLQKKLPVFSTILYAYPFYKDKPLPTTYAQALRMLRMKGQVPDADCLPGTYYHFFKYVAIPEENQQMVQQPGH